MEQEQELICSEDYLASPLQLSEEQLQTSTVQLYEAKGSAAIKDNPQELQNFIGKYAQLRTQLDYSYHKVPNKARQQLQDSLIDAILSERREECKACSEDHEHPHVLFTSGAMASGKSHTLKYYLKNGEVSLPADFIWVDPDRISRMLPERDQYLRYDQDKAPEMLHPEAAMVQEILSLIARERRQSLVIDGSLSDGEWFKKLMSEYREAGYQLEIFFVFADEDVMEERAKQREKETGRQTDRDKIEESAKQAPLSVEKLASAEHVGRVRLVDNSSNDEPPRIVYDSRDDSEFERDGNVVEVLKIVEETKKQRRQQQS